MNVKDEKGINLIALVVTIIVLLIIAGTGVMVGLEGLGSIDNSKKAGEGMEKASIIEALRGEVEDLRTRRLLKGQKINDDDIKQIMEAFVQQTNSVKTEGEKTELTYENAKIISTKGFEITVNEVKE